jgi:hypothetical protein
MNYNQLLSNGDRVLNIQYLGVDRLYNNLCINVVILEDGCPLTERAYFKLLPRFYVRDTYLPNMHADSVVTMLKVLNKLGFVNLKKECKDFSVFLMLYKEQE